MQQVDDYTQAIMDLGATVCTRSRPGCSACPLTDGCLARAAGNPGDYPGPKPKKAMPIRQSTFLILLDGPAVMLQQRPPTGIWGGLWGFPECPEGHEPRTWCRERLGLEVEHQVSAEVLRHTFSHFHLDITPWQGRVQNLGQRVMEGPATVWYKPGQAPPGGLAAPVARLLSRLKP